MSVALALNTFGREMSGSDDMLLSIFSFTSMKAKSMSCPCSKESTIEAEPSRDSVCSPERWSVCTRFCRSVLTTTSSSITGFSLLPRESGGIRRSSAARPMSGSMTASHTGTPLPGRCRSNPLRVLIMKPPRF